MRNYRRFAEVDTIAFEPGLTIISGPNGAGKSTIIEAFLYTLFGPKYRQRIDDIRTDSLKGLIRVECKLHIDDQEVCIIRSGTIAELRINGVVQVQGGPASGKAVTTRVTALLGGLTREQFERTYVAMQGDTAGLVVDKASERREIIEKILQLEVLAKAIELQVKHCDENKGGVISLSRVICDELSLGTDARELMQNFQSARSIHMRSQHTQKFLKKIEQVIAERKRRYLDVVRSVSETQAQAFALEDQYKKHQEFIVQASRAYNEQEERQKQYNVYQESITGVQGKLEQCERDIQKYRDAQEEAEQSSDASAEYARLQMEIRACEKRLERIPFIRNCYNVYVQAHNKLNDLDRQLGELVNVDDDLSQAKEQEAQAKQQLNTLRSNDPTVSDYEEWGKQNSRLEHEAQQNEEALELLKKGTDDARCPTCNQRFIEHTPEYRIQHLTSWLNQMLPPLREQLRQQKQHIEEQKEQWKQEQQQAGEVYDRLQKNTIAIGKKVLTRDIQRNQRHEAYDDFLVKQQAWQELGEEIPDPQMEVVLQGVLDNLSTRGDALKTQANAYAQLPTLQKNLADKQQEQEKLSLAKQELLEQQRALGYDSESFQVAKDLVEQLRGRDKEIKDQLHLVKVALKDVQSMAQQAHKDVEKIQADHNRFGTHVQEYFKEERLCEHLEEFKKYFFQANTEEVMRRTTELLIYAINDQSILGVRFDRDEFQYLDASHIAYPVGRLSGGEKALVGLCLRIALAEQAQTITRIGRVKFLVLDEVLSSLDEERCEAVKRIFADVLQLGIFEHIIMITHLDTVKESWHANGLAVQKLDGKMSTVISVSPGEVPMDLAEGIEV